MPQRPVYLTAGGLNISLYLDYNATAPLRPQVRERVAELLAGPYNASSVHRFGREARKILENAREQVAAAVSAFAQEVVFTASATEANRWALRAFPGRRVLASAVEHSSVLRCADALVSVDGNGIVSLDALKDLLAGGPPALVSIMLANNETGVIQPVAEAAAICKAFGALLHCDAVQGLGKIPVDFGQLGVDMLTVSGHKCGGPVGAAALVVKTGVEISPLFQGGGQEKNRRAGTENIPAIAGFGLACEQAQERSWVQPSEGRRDAMEARLVAHGARIFGHGVPRLPNTSCMAMPGVSSEVQVMHFDLAGIAVSAGSACSSGRIAPSHVLRAMGVEESEAACAIRVSMGWGSAEGEVERFVESWLELAARVNFPLPKALEMR